MSEKWELSARLQQRVDLPDDVLLSSPGDHAVGDPEVEGTRGEMPAPPVRSRRNGTGNWPPVPEPLRLQGEVLPGHADLGIGHVDAVTKPVSPTSFDRI